MEDIKITVEEILEEIEFNKKKQAMFEPQSDMEKVNDMVERLLTEKKTAQLHKEKEEMSQKELEEFEREIKSQTKSITKQFEKVIRENTRQLKRQQREEKAIEKEIRPDEDDNRAYEAYKQSVKNNTQSIKITQVKSDQKVKLQTDSLEILQNEHKKEKFEMLKESAHTEHIKREMDNIASHFGSFIAEKESVDEQKNQSEITLSTYKELKKKRNKKIDNFSLEGQTPPTVSQTDSIAVEEMVEHVLVEKLENQVSQEIVNEGPKRTKDNQVFEYQPDENDDEDLLLYEDEYNDVEEEEEVKKQLRRKKKSIFTSVVGLSILSINALVLALVFVTDKTLQLAKLINISPLVYVAVNMLVLIFAMIFSRKVFSNAIDAMAGRTPHKDILYTVTMLIGFAANMMVLFSNEKILQSGVHIYTPVIVISLLFNHISKLKMVNQTIDNFNYITSGKDIYGVSFIHSYKVSSDMTKGVVDDEPILAKSVKAKFFKNFLSHSFQPDRSDYICTKLTVAVLPIALLLSALAFLFHRDLYISMTVLSGVLVMATTLIGSMIVAFPLHDTSDITKHFSEMSPCVDAIEEFSETNSMLIDAHDIFPSDTVILHGIKTFSGKRIDDAIVDAASVVCESKSILSNVFLEIIAHNKALLKKVDSIMYEDLMGISAWVADRRVLIGNRELMINHSVAVPKKEYEDKYNEKGQKVVYVSSEGELSAAFIIQITTKKEIFDVMNLMERNEVKAIIKTVDSILTAELLTDLFHMESDSIKILPSRLHSAYAQETEEKAEMNTSLGTNGNVLGYIISTIATKKLSFCVRVGVIINILSVVLGIAMFAAVMLAQKLALFSSLVVLLYMGLFGIVYWIYQKNIHL